MQSAVGEFLDDWLVVNEVMAVRDGDLVTARLLSTKNGHFEDRDMLRIGVSFCLACCAGAVAASTPPPAPPISEMTWPSTSRGAPVDGLMLGPIAVHFEKTTLGDVVAANHLGVIDHRGDAGESEYWLCYSLPQKGQRIWIVSSGEMGGREHLVTSLVGEQTDTVSASNDCPALPATTTVALLDRQGWLGMTSTDVKKQFGAPSHRSGAWQAFNFDGKVKSVCSGGADRSNWLWVELLNQHANVIIAGQVTSC
ncbi:hypothetical protein [Dyella koreensis]|uniref:Uncharacterized protein n=1 Tax=Dyella koreensis TaxID=311235 RepID=A0ABW8K3F1_9GAMM